jgi:hypothetical protein
LFIASYKLIFTGFKEGQGLAGLLSHLGHEWVTLANLFCLLMGFALLSRHFGKSRVPVVLPDYLPDDWKVFRIARHRIYIVELLDALPAP